MDILKSGIDTESNDFIKNTKKMILFLNECNFPAKVALFKGSYQLLNPSSCQNLQWHSNG